MAGTLVISTLSDETNSTSSTNCIRGSAKAWVNFNGASGAIRASYNVTSVTRLFTGGYTVNLTNAMSDSNYAVEVSVLPSASDLSAQGAGSLRSGTKTASAVTIGTVSYNDTSFADFQEVDVAIFR